MLETSKTKSNNLVNVIFENNRATKNTVSLLYSNTIIKNSQLNRN
jgi:hypothetical protein